MIEDKRIKRLIELANEYDIIINEEEAEEWLEITDKVNKEFVIKVIK